jgi:hypothetical protein
MEGRGESGVDDDDHQKGRERWKEESEKFVRLTFELVRAVSKVGRTRTSFRLSLSLSLLTRLSPPEAKVSVASYKSLLSSAPPTLSLPSLPSPLSLTSSSQLIKQVDRYNNSTVEWTTPTTLTLSTTQATLRMAPRTLVNRNHSLPSPNST